jgi:hypothetical protein
MTQTRSPIILIIAILAIAIVLYLVFFAGPSIPQQPAATLALCQSSVSTTSGNDSTQICATVTRTDTLKGDASFYVTFESQNSNHTYVVGAQNPNQIGMLTTNPLPNTTYATGDYQLVYFRVYGINPPHDNGIGKYYITASLHYGNQTIQNQTLEVEINPPS